MKLVNNVPVNFLKICIQRFFWPIDIFLAPFILLGSVGMLIVRRAGINRAPISKIVMRKVGILPVHDHFYEPYFDPEKIPKEAVFRSLSIDFHRLEQLNLISSFSFQEELKMFPVEKVKGAKPGYYYNNPSFRSGDAEILYSMIRHFKPKRVIEVGCGYSSYLIEAALDKNESTGSGRGEHRCIEPYRQDKLKTLRASVIASPIETLDLSLFSKLEANDILFIDSSHIIRPGGDILFEYLEILPKLNTGVLIHVHDIFSPFDYPWSWRDEWRSWNEQYLLEAFLTLNSDFKIVASLHYLWHFERAALQKACPVLALQIGDQPGSFWLQRTEKKAA